LAGIPDQKFYKLGVRPATKWRKLVFLKPRLDLLSETPTTAVPFHRTIRVDDRRSILAV